ncbi:Cytochrome c-type biogenesis protein Ccs1/ResB [Dissulfuribacter thermophilus]|uniref:Cytochrome c-type biogenesis protein Ccs1/ResB n=1 Tax=Dissulfuribacter thermophilus TaxID=1156395 RepID=A0A1B9F4A3_9BACT|nr:cytochrome c biogenesis protein ResB [Dissulfuribacter thermophilus]OCC14571.1 Cytochrome c-type biogenesis protein Ccs1/ResB [Dissulfuribacter thermophilus]
MKSQKKSDNPILNFFSSVKLAVVIFIILAIASIVGTIIPQGESLHFYLDRYGPNLFNLIRWLHLDDTYHSWWYLALLGLFSLNLLVCISRRLPYTLELIRRDSSNVDADKLLRMPFKASWSLSRSLDDSKQGALLNTFSKIAGRIKKERSLEDGSRVYLVEKGKWSYWGLYGLHFSLLIIFLGAIIGNFFGFGGSIMIAEGESTDHIYRRGDGTPIPLGFTIRCDKFDVQFYDNGAPKLFRSDLTVIENGKEVLKKEVLVNSPLTYKGVRFYQSSYQAIPTVKLKLSRSDGGSKDLSIPAYKKIPLPEEGLEIGIMQYIPNVHGVPAIRLWVGTPNGGSQVIWVLKGRDGEFNNQKVLYRVSLEGIKNNFMTGLQVKKDPGVPLVYLGCIGLILGIFIAFWVPHKRLWLMIRPKGKATEVIVAGQINKNKTGFKKEFEELKTQISASLGEKI